MNKMYKWFWVPVLFLVIISFGLFIYYFANQSISEDIANWAQFGDYVGGVFGVLAFIGVLITIYLQQEQIKIQFDQTQILKKDLELSREQLKRAAEAQEASQKTLSLQAEIQKHSALISGYSTISEILYKEIEWNKKTGGNVLPPAKEKYHQGRLNTSIERIIECINELRETVD